MGIVYESNNETVMKIEGKMFVYISGCLGLTYVLPSIIGTIYYWRWMKKDSIDNRSTLVYIHMMSMISAAILSISLFIVSGFNTDREELGLWLFTGSFGLFLFILHIIFLTYALKFHSRTSYIMQQGRESFRGDMIN